MTLEDIEKIISAAEGGKLRTVKFKVALESTPKKNRIGEIRILNGVPAEIINDFGDNKYEVMAKIKSLKVYLSKLKETVASL